MIVKHESIDLYGCTLFTRVTMKTPMRGPVPLPSEACFAYIVDGDDQLIMQGETLRTTPGHMILSLCGHTMGQMLSEQNETEATSIIVHFDKALLLKIFNNTKPPFWKELETPVVRYVVQMAASKLIEQYFEGIAHLFQYQQAVTEEMLALKLKEIIILLLQTPNSLQITQIMRSLFSERTFTFKEVVDAHICEPVTIENLAMLTNKSVSSFKREFKKIYNTTPGVYIMNQRTEKVAQLLQVSDESIASIGYQCGFTSAAHLSRVFKSKYGVTPSNYRLNLTDK